MQLFNTPIQTRNVANVIEETLRFGERVSKNMSIYVACDNYLFWTWVIKYLEKYEVSRMIKIPEEEYPQRYETYRFNSDGTYRGEKVAMYDYPRDQEMGYSPFSDACGICRRSTKWSILTISSLLTRQELRCAEKFLTHEREDAAHTLLLRRLKG